MLTQELFNSTVKAQIEKLLSEKFPQVVFQVDQELDFDYVGDDETPTITIAFARDNYLQFETYGYVGGVKPQPEASLRA